MIALLWLVSLAWAEEFFLEVGPLPERAEATAAQASIKQAGLSGRVVRRFRLGHGWEFVVLVEHLPDRAQAEAAAVRLGTETKRPVTVYRMDGDEPEVLQPTPPVGSTPSAASLADQVATAVGGEAGGAGVLARAAAVHFVFDRSLRLNGKDSTFHHDYWREGANRRLAVDGPEADSVAVATATSAWLAASSKVVPRDVGVLINQIDAFAPEAVLAVAVDAWHLLHAPEVASFRVLDGADSGTRIGTGSAQDEPGVSFIDIDTSTHRILRVRYVTEGGPVEYEMSDYREVAPGLVVPFRVYVERGDGRRETLVVKTMDLPERAPAGIFEKPAQ